MNHRYPTMLRHACLACLACLAGFVTFTTIIAQPATTESAPWRTDPARRKEGRPTELWRSYRHGIADFWAKPVALAFPKAPPPTFADIPDPVSPAKKIPVWTVARGQTFTSDAFPFDSGEFAALRGKTLRIFYWMRGENIGRNPTPNSYHDAPQLLAIVKNAKGKQLSKIITHNGAIGTYPWHGYYLDVQIPSSAARLHVQIENLNGETALFARFSHEIVGEQNTCSQNEKQDPETGSLAAFPWHEPINFHLIAKPPASAHVWNFLRGSAAAVIGQPYDLTTLDGLRRYYRESVKTDLDQMNHGIMYFPSRYNFAKRNNVLPPMEAGWLEEVGRLILADQDPETGYWGTASIPKSMSVTFHFVDMLFALGIERTDSSPRPDPARCIANTRPPAEHMVRPTRKLQSTRDGRPAAWSYPAYNWTDTPDGYKNRCQLGSSMNATRLLRIARRFVDADLQRQIDSSIESAFRYMLETVIRPDGLWKQNDTDASPSKPAYWPNIVDYTRYVEPRIDPTLPPPSLERPSPATLRCVIWPERQNSIRIHISDSPADSGSQKIAGIISRGEAKIHELDPWLAVRKMAAAGRDNWGQKAFGSPQGYLYEKVFRQLPKTFPTALREADLTLAPAAVSALKDGKQKLYATAVDWYGRESASVEIR
ncbi:MAG: hypothetical protein LBK99_14015 [Opitutaceae bacterium]|nr:hypothetical protein [Opitutaceae bacterium]